MLKHFLTSFTAIFLFSLICSSAAGFHAGGVGRCEGCHTMHNTAQGVPLNALSPWLIKAGDISSICLTCHAGPGGPDVPHVASQDGSAYTPGGDFYWLTKGFSWTGGESPADRHGHNIMANDFGFSQDVLYGQAPGGTYPSSALNCASCHDPHGKSGTTTSGSLPVAGSGSYGGFPRAGTRLGTYRLLGDNGYNGGSHTQGYVFNYNAPIAVQNPLLPFHESDGSHVDYGSGMSEWCANCHPSYLINEHSAFEHPTGSNENLESEMVNNYNTYLRTGDYSGNVATAYLQFVPFERGTTDVSLLDPTSRQGPGANANVMCLTCHRAHASAFRAIGRWDFDAPLLAASHPAPGDAGASGNDVANSYYGRNIAAEFGANQAQFCEKCHEVGGP